MAYLHMGGQILLDHPPGMLLHDRLELDVFSLFHRLFLNNTELRNIWSPLGIEPRTACIAHKRSATELRQPPGEQTL